MKHLIRLAILSICLVIFSSCSKKTTENFTPTDTYHPPNSTTSSTNKNSIKSSNEPTTEESTFWIGSSLNHNFSIEAGSINLTGVYAINNRENLEKDAYGNLQFYPTKSLADMEFFKSEIGNLDYVEGTYYKVEGIKYYLGSELWAVAVTKILRKVDASNPGRTDDKMIVGNSANSANSTNIYTSDSNKNTTTNRTTRTIRTTKRWQSSKTEKSQKGGMEMSQSKNQNASTKTITPTESWHPDDSGDEPIVMVSKNPPTVLVGIFWVNSSRSGTIRTKNGPMSYSDCLVLNSVPKLEEDSDGGLIFSNGDPITLDFMCNNEVTGFDYEEGYFYQVEGYIDDDEGKTTGVSVYKVLQKVRDKNYEKNSNKDEYQNIDPTESWHPDNSNGQPISMVSKNPPTHTVMMGRYWINSSMNGTLRTKNGPMTYSNCMVLNSKQKLEEDPFGGLIFYNEGSSTLEFMCNNEVKGLDYEEGYLYHVEGEIYLDDEQNLKGMNVTKVLQKVEDMDYVKKAEEMILHIGPGKAKGFAFSGQEIECLQVQYDKYSSFAEWSAYCDQIAGFDPEPGYQYTIKIKRSYKSKRERKMVADDFSLNDKLVTIIKTRRVR